jgi:hypothetical protein
MKGVIQRPSFSTRHGRIYSGHPRLEDDVSSKTWMAGTSPAMTAMASIG